MKYIKHYNTIAQATADTTAFSPFVGYCNEVGSPIYLGGGINNPVRLETTPAGNIVATFNRTITGDTWNASISSPNMKVYITQNTFLNGKVDCYSIEFAQGVSLIIEPGARLRIWEGGIVNSDAENTGLTNGYFVVRENAVTNQYGELLLHPSVTVRNHPKIVYQLYSTCYQKDASTCNWMRCSIPNINIQTFTYSLLGIPTISSNFGFGVWDNSTEVWNSINNLNLIKETPPFAMCNVTWGTSQPGIRLNFKGQIKANEEHVLTVNKTETLYWAFGNGFTGKICTKKMLSYLSNYIDSFGVFKRINNIDTYIEITENESQYPYLYPSETFVIKEKSNQTGTVTLTLSYKDLVWDPSFEEDVNLSVQTRGLMKGTPAELPNDPIFQDPPMDAFEDIEPNNEEQR